MLAPLPGRRRSRAVAAQHDLPPAAGSRCCGGRAGTTRWRAAPGLGQYALMRFGERCSVARVLGRRQRSQCRRAGQAAPDEQQPPAGTCPGPCTGQVPVRDDTVLRTFELLPVGGLDCPGDRASSLRVGPHSSQGEHRRYPWHQKSRCGCPAFTRTGVHDATGNQDEPRHTEPWSKFLGHPPFQPLDPPSPSRHPTPCVCCSRALRWSPG